MSDYLTKFEEEYFEKIKKDCEVVFDVGAGSFSIFYEQPDIEVHYFEPHKISFNSLKELDIKNKKFFINNLGLGSKNETLSLYAEGSLYNRKMSNVIIDTCEVVTGLHYCKSRNIQKIDFLKIDVEGLETEVLRGFGDTLKNIRYIQFEYGIGLRDAGSNLKEIIELLRDYGFKDFYKNGITKIESTFDFWEWCNINTENLNFQK